MKHNRQGAVDVITPDSALTVEQLADLEHEFQRCADSGQPMVVLDMHNVQLLDSRGIELLLDTQAAFRARGGALKLANINVLCSDIFRVTAVATRFELHDEVKSAVGSFVR